MLKIRIFEISKIKMIEKIFFTGNCSSGPKISSVKLLKQSDIGISPGISLKIELHCFERDVILNLFCRVYIQVYLIGPEGSGLSQSGIVDMIKLLLLSKLSMDPNTKFGSG